MTDINTEFENIIAGEKGITVECQVPNFSSTAKHWCTKEGHWLVRSSCLEPSHSDRQKWWVCCDGCREVFEAMTIHCSRCKAETAVQVEVL